MSTFFTADFSYYPEQNHAPVLIEFSNLSTQGYAVDNEYTNIVDPNTFEPISLDLDLSTILVPRIDKYIWELGDGKYNNETNPKKTYDQAGTYQVTLHVYSSELYDITTFSYFRLKTSVTKTLIVNSMVSNWLYSHMAQPQQEAYNKKEGFADLTDSACKVFDRMYSEIKEIANIMDVKTVAPKFLQFFNDTLNHKIFYSKKIGYAEQPDDGNYLGFLDYDIFDKISKNTASENEINTFRQFIIDTASIFKRNGSKEGIEKFFKLYDFVIRVKELWTTNFGAIKDSKFIENFFNDSTLENTKSQFKFNNISVSGLNNNSGIFVNNFNSLLIDNYHYTTLHAVDKTTTVVTSSCVIDIPINDVFPNINAIVRSDGRKLTDMNSCGGNTIYSPCTTSNPQRVSCDLNDSAPIDVFANTEWSDMDRLVNGCTYRIWNAPVNYVQSIINVLGTIPNGDDEIAESGTDDYFDNDDYLWANWKTGITVPPQIINVSQENLRKYTTETNFGNVNLSTTPTSKNLVNVPFKASTEKDFFVVIRGFIEIPEDNYYIFSLENGNSFNPEYETKNHHLSLLSIKHKTKYVKEDLPRFQSVADFSFERNNADHVYNVSTSGTSSTAFSLYGKEGEYGIIEIRQPESSEYSGYYYLESGYYAFEIKSTYGEMLSKKLELSWESYKINYYGLTPFLDNVIAKQVIPPEYFTTLRLENPCNIGETEGKGMLKLPTTLVEGGDVLKVSYTHSQNTTTEVAGFISSNDHKYKDFEMNIRFSPKSIPEEQVNNCTLPQKEMMIMFRGINRGKDLYSNVDNYYVLRFNGSIGELSLCEVSYTNEIEGVYYRKLNLSGIENQVDIPVFTKTILDPVTNYAVEIIDDEYYDLKLVVKDNKVSAYFRYNSSFSVFMQNIKNGIAQNILDLDINKQDYISVFENISLLQSDANTQIEDIKGNKITLSETYSPIDEAGYYGVSIKSSIFEINSITIDPYDLVDNIYETEEKYKTIQPKYLENKFNNILRLNSITNDNSNLSDSLIISHTLTKNYDGSTNVYELPESFSNITDNSIQSLVANNISAGKLGTRFNLWLDPDYVSRFKTKDELLDKIIIPFGKFYEPYVNWTKLETSPDAYTIGSAASYQRCVSDKSHVLPHTILLNSYGEKEYLTDLSRDLKDTSLLSITNTKFADFLNSTNHSNYLGVWEEVCPNSVSSTWDITGSKNKIQSYDNPVFEPIYSNRRDVVNSHVIGVRVMSDSALNDLICRFCEGTIIWGLYEIGIDYNIDKYLPNSNNKTSPLRYFIPIGKLEKGIVYYLPPSEILSSCYVNIELQGVYAYHTLDGFTTLNKTQIQINKFNTFEERYKGKFKCKYFLDIETSFVNKITTDDSALRPQRLLVNCENNQFITTSTNDTECDIPNAFALPTIINNILNYVEQNSTTFDMDYTWWTPNCLYLKRDFDVVYSDNFEENIFTGLNKTGWFYSGNQIISGGIYGTQLVLKDTLADYIGANNVSGNNYVADVEWCVTSTSWDGEYATVDQNTENMSTFERSVYYSMGFDSDTIKNKSKFVMGTEKLITINQNISAPLLIETISVSGRDYVLFGSQINSDSGVYGKTINPVGLFNTFKNMSSDQEMVNAQPRLNDWSTVDWNDHFINCFKFKSLYSEIPSDMFKVNKYWAYYSDHIPKTGAMTKIRTNNTLECEGKDGLYLGYSNGVNNFYSLPVLFENYVNWHSYVTEILIDNELIDSDMYYSRENTATKNKEIVFNSQIFDFSKYVGKTNFVLNVYSDKLFTLDESKTYTDNVYNKREIKWIPYINENNLYYNIAKRSPELELQYTTDTYPYTITTYKNTNVITLNNKFEFNDTNKTSGQTTGNNTEVGMSENHGTPNVMLISDVESNNFTLSCDVIFDKSINDTDLEKTFELILKGENNFIGDLEEFGLTDYYYVGIGTNNFDIGLGMKMYDQQTKTVKDTFLASYGDYNIRNIKADTWYRLKATVTNTEIKIYFNESSENDRLVINYNINKKYEKLSERYLKGEFETLQAVIAGLENLHMTYPNKLNNTVSSAYTYDHFKAEFAATLPINGTYSGVRLFNSSTYISNIIHRVETVKEYKFGAAYDTQSYSNVISKIEQYFGLNINDNIEKVGVTLNNTLYIQIGENLYFKQHSSDPEKYKNTIETFYIINDKIIIIEKVTPNDCAYGLNEFAPGSHSFVWSYSTNTHGISSMMDFYNSVPNLSNVTVIRDSITYPQTSNINLQLHDTVVLTITGSRSIIWPLSGVLGRYDKLLRVFQEGFTQEYAILIKDNTFYKDSLRNYINFTEKKINKIIVSDDKINIIFEDT